VTTDDADGTDRQTDRHTHRTLDRYITLSAMDASVISVEFL